jgi:catechol 2,3-dioxygenase-like lactoylglutathione lyase family enzyme
MHHDNRAEPVVRVARIGHVGISVRDIERTVEFYRRYVGLRLTESFTYPEEEVGHGVTVKSGAFVRCDSTHHCISFFEPKDGVEAAVHATPVFGLHHLAFELRTPEELLAKYREFRSAGIEIVNARRGGPGNQPRFYARDPDGNLIEFYWGIDEIGWTGQPRAYRPIEEIDLEEFDFEAFAAERESASIPGLEPGDNGANASLG